MKNNRNGYRGYNSSRPILDDSVPQQVQNIIIRDYAKRQGLDFKLSVPEYAMPECFMVLNSSLSEIATMEGIILYSIFQLPRESVERFEVYEKVISGGSELHAALEGIVLREHRDIRRIEDIWKVRQAMQHCPSPEFIRDYLDEVGSSNF